MIAKATVAMTGLAAKMDSVMRISGWQSVEKPRVAPKTARRRAGEVRPAWTES